MSYKIPKNKHNWNPWVREKLDRARERASKTNYRGQSENTKKTRYGYDDDEAGPNTRN